MVNFDLNNDGFSTDSSGDGIALFYCIVDDFGVKFNFGADGFEGRDAYFSSFSNLSN